VTTSILALETGIGGILDLARTQHVRMVVAHLGYPAYLLTILGLWKIPAAIVLLIPRFPRLKEWAYAGIFFEMTGAAASHAVFHDAEYLAITLSFSILAIVSWMLRPSSGSAFRSA
jgi:uncharacterized membrane protein YphA (DoxX/SURF4 family)